MKSIALLLLPLLLQPFAVRAENPTKPLLISAPEFAPYVSQQLAGGGWAWEVLEAAFEGSIYQPKLTILPWPRAVRMAEEGAVDALFIANKTPERQRWALFSNAVGDEVTVFWKHRDSQTNYRGRGLSDLRRLKLGALRNSVQRQSLQSEGLEAIALNDFEQGIRLLLKRRLDLVLADRHVFNYLLQKGDQSGRDLIVPLYPAVTAHGFHMAVSLKRDDADQIVETFNKGLGRLRVEGGYRKILQRYGLSTEILNTTPSQ